MGGGLAELQQGRRGHAEVLAEEKGSCREVVAGETGRSLLGSSAACISPLTQSLSQDFPMRNCVIGRASSNLSTHIVLQSVGPIIALLISAPVSPWSSRAYAA